LRLTPRPSRSCCTPVSMLAISTVKMSTGVTAQHPLTVRVCNPGQHPTTLVYCTTKREEPVSSLTDGTVTLTPIWLWWVSAMTTHCQRDVFQKPSRGHNTHPLSYRHPGSKVLPTATHETLEHSEGCMEALWPSYKWILWEISTPLDITNIEKAYQELAKVNLRVKNVSHLAVARTVCHVGTMSASPSTAPSSETQYDQWEEAGVMGSSCQFQSLLVIPPQGM